MFALKQKPKYQKFFARVFVSVFFAIICFSLTANAQVYYPDALNITSVKPVQNQEVSETFPSNWLIENFHPGQIKEELIAISNSSNQTKHITLKVHDAVIKDKNSFSIIENKEGGLSSWVELVDPDVANEMDSSLEQQVLSSKELTLLLAGGEQKTVKVRYNVPKNLKGGFYPGAIVASETLDSNGSAMIMEKGLRLYTNVSALPVITSFGLVSGLFLLFIALTLAFIRQVFALKKTDFNKKAFEKKAAGIGFVSFVLFSISLPLLLAELPANDLKTQIIVDEIPRFYTLKVEWHRRDGFLIPDYYTKTWDGSLEVSNGRFDALNLEDFESNDQIRILNNDTVMSFHTETDKNGDSAIINVWSNNAEGKPEIHYVPDNGSSFLFNITDILNSSTSYTNGLFEVRFSAEVPLVEKERIQALKDAAELLRQGYGSPDAMAEVITESDATSTTVASIPELDHLFIRELPASSEALSNAILTSDYVESIVTESETQKIVADSDLIVALESTPTVVSEITASQDTNVMFLPTDTVHFPAQDFSFDQEKAVSQDLGTYIFVNNKASSWNTYISVSNFKLLSGDAEIPASAVTVDPGDPIPLSTSSETTVIAGDKKTLSSEGDKSTLVQVSSGSDTGQNVFALHPRLQIKIPPGTPAGTYLATMTVTTL